MDWIRYLEQENIYELTGGQVAGNVMDIRGYSINLQTLIHKQSNWILERLALLDLKLRKMTCERIASTLIRLILYCILRILFRINFLYYFLQE